MLERTRTLDFLQYSGMDPVRITHPMQFPGVRRHGRPAVDRAVGQTADPFVGEYAESRVCEEGAPVRSHTPFLHL
ncbi:hypothetical protein EES37_33495 [Streptomyces sp. ADI91-18]|nr:hypothetical protein EES37_33495 [Streptomyces sp. ADI91-18]